MRPPGQKHGGGEWPEGHGSPYRGRVGRGEVRDLMLGGLLDGPAHGYELIRRLEEKTAGRWRPSPGSVYPMLQLFEDQGLVRGRDESGRRVYELSDEGRAQASPKAFRGLAAGPDAGSNHLDLRDEVRQLHMAARQVGTNGSDDQVQRAVELVRRARQALYRLLAEQ